MIVISIQEAVGTGGVMVEDHDIGAVGGIGRGIGIVGHGIDIPAVVGIYLGRGSGGSCRARRCIRRCAL